VTAEQDAVPHADHADHPAAPWRLVGSMWVTAFRLGADAGARPRGLYLAAFVQYAEGSVLTYSELLVARALGRSEGRAVTITDIWVDSPASMAGGRDLWAIPKGLCDFDLDTAHRGPVSTTDWTASRERRPIASACFRDVSRVAPRVPFAGRTHQPPLPDADPGTGRGDLVTRMRGTARSLPARARWDLAADGPLAYLRDARQLASVRLLDFRLDFG
jgi:hypothetical protein